MFILSYISFSYTITLAFMGRFWLILFCKQHDFVKINSKFNHPRTTHEDINHRQWWT